MGMSAGGRLMQRYSMLNAVQNNYPTIEFKYVCKAIPDYLHPNEEALSSSAIQRYMTRNKLSPESVIEQYKTRNILYITGTKDSQNYLENMDEFELDAKEFCGDEYSETQLFHKLDGAGHSEPSLTKSKIVQDFLWGKRQDNTVSIDTQPVSNVNIYTQKRTIVVENATKKIFVYDAIGRLIARRDARQFVSTINIKESGVYIVKIGNLTKKIFVE